MRKRSGVIAVLEARKWGYRPIGQWYLPWLVWISLLFFCFLIPIRSALAQEAGEIVSVLGAVEVMREGRWQLIGVGDTLAAGEVVRTGVDGRVAIQLANGSQLKINANSHLELKQITPREGLAPTTTHRLQNILRVISGEVWIRSAEPLEIQTLPVTATIRGTEFNLAVGPSDFARLAVLDGLVEFSNPQGSVLVAANEQATAKLGEPPRKTVLLNPIDAVQWSLYYPDPAGDRAERERAERTDPPSSRYWTWTARNHLLRGQVPEAQRALDRALALDPNDARAYALRAAVALVQNRKAEARTDAERAVAADPAAPEAHLALSWVQQAEFDLDGALASARKAAQLDPDDPQALIQESRLLFGMGRTKEATKVAEKARQRAPNDALVNSTWGFLQLARGRVKEANQAFQEAIAQDSTLGEPHLGLGLALFRRNKTEAAVEEMRKATLLEPKVSLYNSYLGKAYYEIKDDRLAQKYFEAAKQLDPRDPTPYLYNAIRLQSVNQPVEGVQDLQKSIELNDDRAVYRSRFLLDEDLAARGTALGKIYNSIGFEQLGLNEGWKSLAHDPANYSAHRLLADSYLTLPRHEIARASELLQSQLLQSINTTPVQPQLAETNLFILAGAGPTTASLYEYNPLLVRDRLSLLSSAVIGINGTLGDEVVLSGIEDRFSYSLGQFHYRTDGFRENNDLQHDIFNLFAQVAVTPNFNLQAEFRRRETDQGDLRMNFNPENFSAYNRSNINQDTARLGMHWAPSPQSDVLLSFIHTDRKGKFHFLNPLKEVPGFPPINYSSDVATNNKGTQAEAQYFFRTHEYNIITGISSYEIDVKQYTLLDFTPFPCLEPKLKPSCKSESTFSRERDNAYIYSNITYLSNLIWTIGLSYDAFQEGKFDSYEWNPKLGLQWNISDNARLRFAAFQTIKPALVVEQTLEPTQIAGFNQFFDDTNGAKSKRYGIGFDSRLTENFYAGIEVSYRHIKRPVLKLSDLELNYFENEKERLYSAYLYWIPNHRWAIGAEYQLENFKREPKPNILVDGPTKLETMTLPLTVQYFDPSGIFTKFEAIYVNQDIKPGFKSSSNGDEENFFLLNAAIGYRFPKRQGIFSIETLNLLDKEFRFQDINFQNSTVENPRFIPDRLLLTRFTLNY